MGAGIGLLDKFKELLTVSNWLPIFTNYDKLNQVIAVGPVLSPFGDQAEGWLRTKYDGFGRVVYTLWQKDEVNINALDRLVERHGTTLHEKRTSRPTNVEGIIFNYTNQVEPMADYQVLTVNYYDDYDWDRAPTSIPSTVCDGISKVDYRLKLMPKGLPTGNWTRIITDPRSTDGKIDHVLYAFKSRAVRMHTDHPEGGYTTVDSKFGFLGNNLKTITAHRKDRSSAEQKIEEEFTYNDQMRPVSHIHTINDLRSQLISRNSYNDLGQVSQKRIGGEDVSGAMPLQSVDYKYNIRGWLTQINDVDNLRSEGGITDLFAFNINYDHIDDSVNGAVKELYNGNIAETTWRTINDNIQRRYGYSYDGLNRITAAFYQLPDLPFLMPAPTVRVIVMTAMAICSL